MANKSDSEFRLQEFSRGASIRRTDFSDFIRGGRVVHRDILEEIYAEINEMYGTNEDVP